MTGLRGTLAALREKAKGGIFSLPAVGPFFWKKRLADLETIPRTLNIEVTSICNTKCIMCPRHDMDRKMEVMPFELYSKIVAESRELGVKTFALNGYGELFTARKDWRRYVEHLLSAIPAARIIINSNGSLLDEEAARFLIASKVHTVNVDIDGATKETFESIRLNLNYEAVVRNVKRLIELRKSQNAALPRVRVGMIRQPLNTHEFELFRAQWDGVADSLGDDFMVTRGGSILVSGPLDVSRPCWLIWSDMSIWSNGEVVLCCDDWNCREVMGNIREKGIREIWNGEKFRAYRRHHVQGTAGQIALCGACNFARPGPDWFQDNIRR